MKENDTKSFNFDTLQLKSTLQHNFNKASRRKCFIAAEIVFLLACRTLTNSLERGKKREKNSSTQMNFLIKIKVME